MAREASEQISFEWALRRSELESQRNLLLSNGAELSSEIEPFVPPTIEQDDYAHAAFEPLMVLAGAVAIVFLAERIVDLVKDARHGGLLVDTRAEKLLIREQPSLRRGTIFILLPNGDVKEFNSSNRIDISTVIAVIKEVGAS